MTTLDEHVYVASRYSRSANLERDAQAIDALDGYMLTGRVMEMLDRITTTAINGTGGSWSVTGPYGSGKSSLGVFVDALFGPSSSASFERALKLVDEVAPELATRIVDARDRLGSDGYARALVTARTEPVTHTVTRALDRAVRQTFGHLPTAREFPEVRLLKAAIEDVSADDPRRTGPAPGSLVELAIALADRIPVVLVIDEFGKNLEAAQQRTDADLYLLQLLAEAAESTRGAPIFLITMQHLAFNDYASAADTAQQREWAKIQGRFEDIVFVDSVAQTQQLIAAVFDVDATINARVQSWAEEQAQHMAAANLYEIADAQLLSACYPLHPLTLAVLPELCSRYGQNERTLFGFLTGPDSRAVPALMRDRSLDDGLPTIGLPDVYDFFVSNSNTATAGTAATRWSEVSLRLRDAAGIAPGPLSAAKSIAVLNLVASSGPLRASRQLLTSGATTTQQDLDSIQELDLVVYRDVPDEYRIWQGTGVDIAELIERARETASERPPVQLLQEAAPLAPAVATGHAMRTDTLRTFERQYIDTATSIEALSPGSLFDGSAYFAVDPSMELLKSPPAGLPVIVQVPTSTNELISDAVEVHALSTVLNEAVVADDWVARAEIRERLSSASRQLHDRLDEIASTGSWYLLTDSGPQELLSGPGSTPLSDAADRCYPESPPIRNETLNRVELTSQGAKARRQLLLAMLENEHLDHLGLEGFGPEVAMYNALLGHTRAHRVDTRHKRWAILPPTEPHLQAAWGAVNSELRRATDRRVSLSDIHAVLRMPPIGMKQGPIPVLVTAVLIATRDEVALYEHGTFRPVLTEEICDRMVRNPNHFEVKHYANASGVRQHVVVSLATTLGIEPRHRKQRVGNVLAVVSELVSRIGALPTYTLRAQDLSNEAIGVREAIATAVEPDELLFSTLPEALGLAPFEAKSSRSSSVDTYSIRLAAALEELEDHFSRTLRNLTDELFAVARESGRESLTAQARVLEGEVIDPQMRSFVLALASDSFDDDHWIENLATVITRAAPRLWTVDDRARYRSELNGRLVSFRRLLMLHSELRQLGASPFDAHRITLTASTGHEDAVLVAIDDVGRSQISQHAEALVTTLTDTFGTRERAEKALLGWAAERVLPHVVTPIEQNQLAISTTKAVSDG